MTPSTTPYPWTPRGIGCERNLRCFICGTQRANSDSFDDHGYLTNIAAFIDPEHAATISDCFDHSRIDFEQGSKVAQVKVGACDDHVQDLEQLAQQWFVSANHVERLLRRARVRDSFIAERTVT